MCEIRGVVSRLVGAATAMAAGRPAKSRNATATEPTSSSVSPALTAYPRALVRDSSFISFAWVVIDRSVRAVNGSADVGYSAATC